MKLVPPGPAGRSSREALAFVAEIARLRGEGHSCEAIRVALLDAGLRVSSTTVKREVARLGRTVASTDSPLYTPAPAYTTKRQAAQADHSDIQSPSGRDIAARWMKDHIANPLMRARIANESGGH